MSVDINFNTAAVCGIFCPSCELYIATQENDLEKVKAYAIRAGQTVEETLCDGCRSERLNLHCRMCQFRTCSEEKGIDFCSECAEFPCEALRQFSTLKPHLKGIIKSLELIRDKGLETWWEKMLEEQNNLKD